MSFKCNLSCACLHSCMLLPMISTTKVDINLKNSKCWRFPASFEMTLNILVIRINHGLMLWNPRFVKSLIGQSNLHMYFVNTYKPPIGLTMHVHNVSKCNVFATFPMRGAPWNCAIAIVCALLFYIFIIVNCEANDFYYFPLFFADTISDSGYLQQFVDRFLINKSPETWIEWLCQTLWFLINISHFQWGFCLNS